MCGIAGIHLYGDGPKPDESEAVRIRDVMEARGPDAAGLWTSSDQKTILAHRRLSIIDLSPDSNQPMSDGQGLCMVFNGEIYNYKELRAGLIDRGVTFRTQGDSEVIMALYREQGAKMLPLLRGMFAFAIYNSETGELFAARDSFGIKPLYYADNGNTLRFASSVKALSKGAVSDEVDDAGLAGFLMFGSVPEPFTTLRAVRVLGAGEMLSVVPGGKLRIERWDSLAKVMQGNNKSEGPRIDGPLSDEDVARALRESIGHHMVADTPVGLFLSAGIDSTTILALLKDAGYTGIKTITAKFEEFDGNEDDESVLAAKAAKYYDADHTEYLITRAAFDKDFPHFLEAMDQPTIDGLNTWFVAKAAKENGLKVCLSGLGADELFGGYPSFQDIPKWSKLGIFGPTSIRRPMMGMIAKICEKASINLHPKGLALLGLVDGYGGAWRVRRGLFMPWEVQDILGKERATAAFNRLAAARLIKATMEPDPKSGFGRVILLESALYMRNQLLRDSDWASMAHSVELRVPFVDRVLFETLAPRLAAHHSPGKKVLTRAPENGLMFELVNRPKTGFTVPIAAWTESKIAGLNREYSKSLTRGHWSRRWALEVKSQYNSSIW